MPSGQRERRPRYAITLSLYSAMLNKLRIEPSRRRSEVYRGGVGFATQAETPTQFAGLKACLPALSRRSHWGLSFPAGATQAAVPFWPETASSACNKERSIRLHISSISDSLEDQRITEKFRRLLIIQKCSPQQLFAPRINLHRHPLL